MDVTILISLGVGRSDFVVHLSLVTKGPEGGIPRTLHVEWLNWTQHWARWIHGERAGLSGVREGRKADSSISFRSR